MRVLELARAEPWLLGVRGAEAAGRRVVGLAWVVVLATQPRIAVVVAAWTLELVVGEALTAGVPAVRAAVIVVVVLVVVIVRRRHAKVGLDLVESAHRWTLLNA